MKLQSLENVTLPLRCIAYQVDLFVASFEKHNVVFDFK